MNVESALCQIDEQDDALVAAFSAHPLFDDLEIMDRSEIVDVLIQRRFLSLAFTPLYDMAIDGLRSRSTKARLRDVLREEYGSGALPTHREDLVSDLIAVGATKDQIVSASMSPSTLQVLIRLFEAMRKTEIEALYQIKILTTLRLACEVLVAKEYAVFWPHLQRLGLTAKESSSGTRSVFYFPHISHDARRRRLGGETDPLSTMTHSDILTGCLRKALLRGPTDGFEFCSHMATAAENIKRSFYDQFPRAHRSSVT